MNLMQFLDIMKEYSISVLIIAFLVCGLTTLIKKLVPISKKKFLTFVPFVFGIILYALYLLITEGISEILKPDTIISGFECGGAATIYYVVYEQFIRNGKLIKITSKEELLVMGILNNVIKPECLEEVSKEVNEIIKENFAETELIIACEKIIKENAVSDLSSGEIEILIKLIIETKKLNIKAAVN